MSLFDKTIGKYFKTSLQQTMMFFFFYHWGGVIIYFSRVANTGNSGIYNLIYGQNWTNLTLVVKSKCKILHLGLSIEPFQNILILFNYS